MTFLTQDMYKKNFSMANKKRNDFKIKMYAMNIFKY